MPEVGVRTGARILIDVGDGDGDGSTFPTAGHLAAHAGLAPTTRSRVLDPRRTAVPEEDPSSSNGPSSSPSFAASGDPASRIHHDRVTTQDARTHALIDRRPHTRFAQDRQSAGRPPARHPPPRPKTQGHPGTGRNRRAGSPPGPSRPAPTGGRATVGPAEGRSCRGRSCRGGGRAGERRESTVPGGSGRPRIAA
ncbi:hypothetical protein ACFCXF_39865 [Streptomyces virginiae]